MARFINSGNCHKSLQLSGPIQAMINKITRCKDSNSSAKVAVFELEPTNFDRSRANRAVFEREATARAG